MTRFRRFHTFQLAVAVGTVTTVLILLVTLRNPGASTAGFAVLALLGLGPLVDRESGIADERDRHHHWVALRVANAASWILVVLVATGLVLTYSDSCVPTHSLTLLVLGGWTVQTLVGSSTAIVLDRRGL